MQMSFAGAWSSPSERRTAKRHHSSRSRRRGAIAGLAQAGELVLQLSRARARLRQLLLALRQRRLNLLRVALHALVVRAHEPLLLLAQCGHGGQVLPLDFGALLTFADG